MGAYLSAPNTEKISSDETHDHLQWGVSGMQGWRVAMEDAHCCLPAIDSNMNSMFGLFDGHGGREVAEYCAKNLQYFLLDTDAYREGDIKSALKQAFLAIDEAITSDQVIAELKEMTNGDINHEDGDEDENEADLLREEANMPLEELIERYKGNIKEHFIQNGILKEDESIDEEDEKENKDKKLNGQIKETGEKESSSEAFSSFSSKKFSLADDGNVGSSLACDTKDLSEDTVKKNDETETEEGSCSSSKSTNQQKSNTKSEDQSTEDSNEVDDDEDYDSDDANSGEEEDSDDDGEFEDSDGMEFQQDSDEVGRDSGTTATVAVIHNNILYVANAGDSRCVICRNGKAVEMSLDHKPEDEIEKSRIEKAGGKITSDGRVMGGLNLSRAIGDHAYKQNKELSLEDQMITSCPDIKELTITKDDRYMVLACDGIWNVMTNEEVIEYINNRLDSPKKPVLSKICEDLFDQCLAPNTENDGTGCDNMTCMIVEFNHSNKTSDRKESKKRTLSEDIKPQSKKVKQNGVD